MAQDIFAIVKQVIAKELELEEEKITPEARIQEDLGADSLDVMNITMRLEDEFNLRIPDEDLTKISTVQDIVDYIQSHIQSS